MRLLLLTLFFGLALAVTCQAAPVITSPPVISGEAVVGQRLEATDTQVEEAMEIDLTLSWERSMDAGSFVEIPGAHDTAYLVATADAGSRLRVHVVVETAEEEMSLGRLQRHPWRAPRMWTSMAFGSALGRLATRRSRSRTGS